MTAADVYVITEEYAPGYSPGDTFTVCTVTTNGPAARGEAEDRAYAYSEEDVVAIVSVPDGSSAKWFDPELDDWAEFTGQRTWDVWITVHARELER